MTERENVTLSRPALVQALNMAADVMRNAAAVAKSNEWKDHYRDATRQYRDAAVMLNDGAKLTIK